MSKFLLTCFEPFHTYSSNPSCDVLEEVVKEPFEDFTTVTCCLPVVPDQAKQDLLSALEDHQPDAILMMGLSAGIPHMTLERVAINKMDFRYPDNQGDLCQNQPVIDNQDAPVAYLSTLPLEDIKKAWQELEIPSIISNSAGLYLCNFVMYQALHQLQTQQSHLPCGFLHLPASPAIAMSIKSSESPIPYLPLDEMVRAVRSAMTTIMQNQS